MSTVRRAARNISALFLAQLIVRSSGIIVTALVARHLGGANFGSYTLSISFASLFGVIAGLGIRQIVVRHIILEPEHEARTLGSALIMHLIQALVTVAAIIVVAKVLGYESTKFRGILLMSITVSFMAFESLFYAVIEAHERMDVEGLLLIVRQAIWIGLALLAIATGEGYLVLLTTMLATAAIITLVSGLVVWRKFCRFPIALHGPTARALWWAGIPLAGAAILVDIYLKVDIVMLDKMLGELAVGWYGASYRLVQVLLFLSGSFFTVVYPIFSRLQREDPEKLVDAYERSLKMISLALVPVAAGISALAGPIIGILYGMDFIPGAAALGIAVWGVAIYGLAVVMGRMLLSIQKQKIIFFVSLFSVLLNITLNFIFIPLWGIRGAAFASVLTIAAVALLNYLAVGHYVTRPHLFHLLWKIYAAGIIMAVAVWAMRGDLPLWLIVPAGAAIYVILILVSGALDDRDKAMVLALLRRGASKETEPPEM